jgi:hypothetical protein
LATDIKLADWILFHVVRIVLCRCNFMVTLRVFGWLRCSYSHFAKWWMFSSALRRTPCPTFTTSHV